MCVVDAYFRRLTRAYDIYPSIRHIFPDDDMNVPIEKQYGTIVLYTRLYLTILAPNLKVSFRTFSLNNLKYLRKQIIE